MPDAICFKFSFIFTTFFFIRNLYGIVFKLRIDENSSKIQSCQSYQIQA